jgi:hypothetical protein
LIAQAVQRWTTGWTIVVPGFDSRRGLGNRCSFPGGKAARAWSWPLTSF